jgi:hypothetical protein
MTEWDDLAKQKICHLKLRQPLDDLKRLMEFWFNNPDSDYNLEKNFVALQEKHKQYITLVDRFVQTTVQVPSTLEDLTKQLDSLGKEHEKYAQALGEVVRADEIFAYSIDTLVKGLEENKAILKQIFNEDNVDPELQPTIEEIISTTQSWIDKAIYLKKYILQSSQKRSLLFGLVLDKLRLYLESEYASKSSQKLEDLQGQIGSILDADDLLREIENWWFHTALLNGFGNGFLSKYLQYEKPLYIMRSNYAEGLSFLDRIDALNLPPNTRSVILNELQGFLDTLNVEIKKLTSQGWQPLFERQKFLVSKREEISSRFSARCKEAISSYKLKEEDIKTLEEFSTAEMLYFNVVNYCHI